MEESQCPFSAEPSQYCCRRWQLTLGRSIPTSPAYLSLKSHLFLSLSLSLESVVLYPYIRDFDLSWLYLLVVLLFLLVAGCCGIGDSKNGSGNWEECYVIITNGMILLGVESC